MPKEMTWRAAIENAPRSAAPAERDTLIAYLQSQIPLNDFDDVVA